MTYILGIDGGGTNTRAVLADNNGIIYAYAVAGPSNPNIIDDNALKDSFIRLFNELKKEAPNEFQEVTTVFAGIAGTGSKVNNRKVKSILNGILPNAPTITVDIDAMNALYSGTYGEPGIVQIAGTGSITYGINKYGHRDRVGGWGYLLGDEGSGYYIGQKGINASLRACDGRIEKTVLTDMVLDYFQVKNGMQLISSIYSSSIPKNEISNVSKIVFQAFKQGDIIAKEIISSVSKELSLSIITLYRKLFHENNKVRLVLCGGVFSDPDIVPPLIKKELSQSMKMMDVVLPKLPPVGGSIIGAVIKSGNVMNQTLTTNLISEFKEWM